MGESRRRVLWLLLGLSASAGARSISAGHAGELPLAIKGYDPVAYFTFGRPERGSPEYEYDWDEQRYLFSRPEHRDMFRADPARYAPHFANVCAMALTRGETDEVNPDYWLVSDGRLYLFGKAIGPALFQQDLANNLMKAEESWRAMRKN